MQYTTQSEQETKNLAQEVLGQLKDEYVLLLHGNLGSGKTVFAKGLAESLGIQEVVTSPTFVIMKVYPIASSESLVLSPKDKGLQNRFKRMVHVDLYRLDNISQAQLRELGLQEYLEDPETLVVIEWPELDEQKLVGKLISFTVEGEQRIISW